MKHRQKIVLSPRSKPSDSPSHSSDDPSPSPSSASHSITSESEEGRACMNEISAKIRNLEKKLQQQTKKNTLIEPTLQPVISHNYCERCEGLEEQNRRLREQNKRLSKLGAVKRTRAKSKEKGRLMEADQIRQLARQNKSKLQKQVQLLGIVERLQKKLRASILRKRQG